MKRINVSRSYDSGDNLFSVICHVLDPVTIIGIAGTVLIIMFCLSKKIYFFLIYCFDLI